MAKQRSIIKVQGTVGDLTFYKRNGEHFLKEKTSLSKEKIQNDPRFIRTRENNQEFGGATQAGKALRMGLVNELKNMSDSNCTGRIVKLCRTIISKDTVGSRGKRSFLPAANKELFQGFPFSRDISFDSVFLAPYAVTANADRNEVTIVIPDFNTGQSINAPAGATHVRIINLVSVLSAYQYNLDTKKYEPSDADYNSKYGFGASDYIPLGVSIGADTTLVSSLDGAPVLAADSVLISCIGVEFYQQTNSDYYLLSSGNAMKIQNVF